MIQKLILVRHAQASGQSAGDDLTAAGHLSARALVPVLTDLGGDAVYCSPYLRAVNTARPFATRMQFDLQIVDDLRERILSPCPMDDWQDHLRQSFMDPAYALPGGESMDQVRARALSGLAAISATGHARPVVVSHGNLIASLLAGIDGRFGFEDWAQMANPDVFLLTLEHSWPAGWARPSVVG
jgi:2,3-bisphosphoglycerate-dependent phosphoglycerate mutase